MQQKKSAATIAANNPLVSASHNNSQQQQLKQLQQQQEAAGEANEPDLAPAGKPETEVVLPEIEIVASASASDENSVGPDEIVEQVPESRGVLGEDFPFADSSFRDGDTSSDSTSNEPKDESPKTDEDVPEPKSEPVPEPVPKPVPKPVVPTKSGKIPPEVPARKSKEGNGNGTKVYHSEII